MQYIFAGDSLQSISAKLSLQYSELRCEVQTTRLIGFFGSRGQSQFTNRFHCLFRNFFELVRFDFILDDQLKAWLLEVWLFILPCLILNLIHNMFLPSGLENILLLLGSPHNSFFFHFHFLMMVTLLAFS